jgi:methionyl aminopeptidase
MISIKSSREIAIMQESCTLAMKTLELASKNIKIGMSTDDLNTLLHDYIVSNGAVPSPLNYHGFPKSICTSLNEVICHGIPSKKAILKDGDILNVDVTTYYKNFHGDTNATFFVGNVSSEAKKLVEVAYKSMMAGIEEVRPGARLGNIGAAIQELAEDHGYSVVRDYCGHGIGREFHEDPQVLHYGKRGTGPELRPGMVFTIEPMINVGSWQCRVLKDDWTVITKDKKLSAQFEHTILVTEDGYEIMTLPENNYLQFEI